MPEDNRRAGERQAPSRTRRPPLVTRDQAIDTAYRLVDEEGPSGLSMRRLAGALHVSLPTVYTAIESREALVERLLDRLVDEIASALALDAASPAPPGRRDAERELQRCGRALLDWTSGRPDLTTFLLTEEIGPGVAERAVRAAPPARRASALALFRAIAGSDSADIDPVVALTAIVAQGRAALWLVRQERLRSVSAARWIELGCDNVARALRALGDEDATGRD
jgi:AcrR family transcriptional regulator